MLRGHLPPLAPSSDLTSSERQWLLVGVGLSMVGVAASCNPLAVCLTSVGRSFGDLGPDKLGLLSTFTFAGVVLGILLAGPAADRWGLRPFMIIGSLGQTLCLAGMSSAPSYWPFVIWGILMGMWSGVIDALASPLVSALEPQNRTGALNLLHACYPVGAMLMVGSSSWLLGHLGSWRIVFPIMSLPMAGSFLIFLKIRFPQQDHLGIGWRVYGHLVRFPAFWVGLFAIFLAGATEMGVAQWTPAYVEKGLFKPAHVGANALLGFSLMMTVGRLGMGALRHRIPPAALMLTSTGLCVVCILAASALPPPLAISSLVIFGLCVACLWPTTLAYAADRIPGSGATLFSLLAVAGNAGCMVSPGWIGVIASKSSLRWGIAALTVFPLAATVLWGIQRLKEDPEV